MSEVVILMKSILCCPECVKRKKIRRFSDFKSLNIHLKMKHKADYKLEGQLSFIPRIS